MTEINRIKQSLARKGKKAYESCKNNTGAYVMRGNSIVRVTSDGSISVVKRTQPVSVKINDSDRAVVIK